MADQDEAFEFMRRFSFGILISTIDNIPVATHLPFVVEKEDDKVKLVSHFARANSQWENIGDHPVLAVFNEPHAYISPRNYEKKLNVPTWNYVAVHAYGKLKVISEYETVIDLLEKTILIFEKAYKDQWDSLPDDYKIRMTKGIVAFEIEVTELQAKKKLSQNKSKVERENIIQSLSQSDFSNEKDIAAYMQTEQKK